MAAETGSHAIGGVPAPIVLGEDLDILMAVSPFELVLDPEVGEVHVVVEVWEVVFMGPCFDLPRVPLGAAVAVRPAAIVCLEKALVVAFEVALEDDAANLRALSAERLLCAEVGAIEGRVMRQLTGPADACVEGLVTGIAAAAPVRIEQAVHAPSG
jgi:hypothetical protein